MEMHLRFAILKAETKLAFLLALELILLNSVAMVLITQFPWFLFLMWMLEGRIYFKPVAFYVLAVVIAVTIRKAQLGSEKVPTDIPLTKPLSSNPSLQEFTTRATARLGKRVAKHVHFALSPVPWSPFGADLDHAQANAPGLPLPVTLLETWSLSELEAYVARTAVAHHGPRWLISNIEGAIKRLASEQYQTQVATRGMSDVRSMLLRKYADTLRGLRLFEDVEADFRVARIWGPELVMSLIYKTELARAFVPAFITSVLEPAIDRHVLLPVAGSYSLYASAGDPHWRSAVTAALRENERNPGSGASSLIARLAILSAMPQGTVFQDPRSAVVLFRDLKTLEREVAANEFGRERTDSASDMEGADSVRLSILPHLRDEVERNIAMLAGKTRFDIPSLLRDKTTLAAAYRPDPKFLLAHTQRVERIPYLLGAFLALDLMNEEWEVSFEFGEGIELRSGSRKIQPFTVVEQLDKSTISDEEFTDAVR
jgi:hypothetical protein